MSAHQRQLATGLRRSVRFGVHARASAFAIVVWATCGCVFLAAGCGGQPSPTAPDGPSPPPQQGATQTHIRGEVTDRVGRALAGALVGVIDGPLAGITTLTDGAGRFELTGTAVGTVTLRASRDGFHTRNEALSWQPPTSSAAVEVRFWLDTLTPPIGLDPGHYTLTVAIDLPTARGHSAIPQAPCAGFPVELASRSYRATIVEVSPPAFYNRTVSAEDRPLHFHNLFSFGVAGHFVGFEMDHGIPEDFPGFRFLNIIGVAPTTEPAIATGSSVSIPFYGEFRYCQLKSERGTYYNDCSQLPAEQIVDYHSCTSDHATMVFTKR